MCVCVCGGGGGGADLIDGGKNSVKRKGKFLSLAKEGNVEGNVCLTEHLNWRLLSSMSNIYLINEPPVYMC